MPSVLHVLPHPGGGGEKYIDILERMPGYTADRVHLSLSRTPLGAATSIPLRWPQLRRAASEHDLVHLHGDMASMLALPLMRRTRGVVSTHGLSFLRRASGLPLRVAQARWSQAAATARRIVCASTAERDELLALARLRGQEHSLAERLVVVPNGIDPPAPIGAAERGSIRESLGLADGELVALFLGLLDRYKDPLTAVRAAQAAIAQGAPVTLLVAGDGPLLEQVRAEAATGVRLLGFRDDPERLLRAADVFVMPSHREGGSYALLEAMGDGLAVVASDGAGIPEMVGDAGIVVERGNVAAFADALTQIASDPGTRAQLGARARERVLNRFTADRFVDGIRRVYDDVLSEAPAPPS